MRIYSGPINYDAGAPAGGIEILGTVSEGRSFRVLKARRGSKFVILKTPLSADAMSVEILRREYELSRSLSHPCVVSTEGFEPDTPVGPAIVMEYIDGLTLDEFVAHGATLAQKRAVLKDILEGVDYLHHRGILHNDLKPDNIIVGAHGAARIIDFGLSASADSVYQGCIGGSDGYTAPEILEGEGPAGAASDIYSIGLLLRLLFGSGRYGAQARRCCRKAPFARYQSIGALRKAISRRDASPWICAGAAVLAVIAILAASPLAQKISTESKVYSLEEQYEAQLSQRFDAAVETMKAQDYEEFAAVVHQDYFNYYFQFADSLQKAHPMSDTGEIAPEIFASCAVIKRQKAVLDSILTSKPSITTLPTKEQGALIEELETFAKNIYDKN